MQATLPDILKKLRANEAHLRMLGVAHASVFGSVARGEAGPKSDIDILVELDERRPMGVFEYSRLGLYIDELLDGAGDVVSSKTLKPLIRDGILHDAINAF